MPSFWYILLETITSLSLCSLLFIPPSFLSHPREFFCLWFLIFISFFFSNFIFGAFFIFYLENNIFLFVAMHDEYSKHVEFFVPSARSAIFFFSLLKPPDVVVVKFVNWHFHLSVDWKCLCQRPTSFLFYFIFIASNLHSTQDIHSGCQNKTVRKPGADRCPN